MSLFNRGEYTLHSGKKSEYKIDCDALTDEDLECMAYLLYKKLPSSFGVVEGVPTGGFRLAEKMRKYANPESEELLIVDDVFTTGDSIETQRAGRDATEAVLFVRNKSTISWRRRNRLWYLLEIEA